MITNTRYRSVDFFQDKVNTIPIQGSPCIGESRYTSPIQQQRENNSKCSLFGVELSSNTRHSLFGLCLFSVEYSLLVQLLT